MQIFYLTLITPHELSIAITHGNCLMNPGSNRRLHLRVPKEKDRNYRREDIKLTNACSHRSCQQTISDYLLS